MSNKIKESIPIDDIEIKPIHYKHKTLLNQFKTNNKELKDFLTEDALNNQEMCISKTYLWLYKPTGDLISYVTLMADAIRIQGTHLQSYFREQGIPYKSLPALKIGRLCVDEQFERKSIGTQTTLFTMTKAFELNKIASCRFIIVDAKREAVNFYKKKGFSILRYRDKGTIPMYYDMVAIYKYFEERKENLF